MSEAQPRPKQTEQQKPKPIEHHTGPGKSADEARNRAIERKSAGLATNTGQSSHGPARR